MANTDLADINELYVGYYLMGEKWWSKEASQHVSAKTKIVGAQQHDLQKEKARVMALEIIDWSKKAGYSGRVKNVWWTARPGSLSAAVGKDVDQKKNPTDILVKFTSGPANGFLGVSAKSTKGGGDIGFKNPGIGTVEATLKLDLSKIVTEDVAYIVNKFKLPENASARKQEIRKSNKVSAATQAKGSETLEKIRDAMFDKLKKMNQPSLRNYLIENWLDASNDLYPPYIKATGMGNKIGSMKAKIDDPLKNDKLKAILKDRIKIEKIGNDSIGVSAGSKRIMKMRAKFESEKLASSVKFSGDPW